MPIMLNWPNLKIPLRSCQLTLLHNFYHYTKLPLHPPQNRRKYPQNPAVSAMKQKSSVSAARSVLVAIVLSKTFVCTYE